MINAGILSQYSSLLIIRIAEPVRYGSIELFKAVFGKYGLNPDVIFPSYGLAEHTVFVSRYRSLED